MKQNPWFTEADLAEIDTVARVLVDSVCDHKERCQACADSGSSCPVVYEAIEVGCRFAETRALISKAEELRRRHVLAALRPLTERRPHVG